MSDAKRCAMKTLDDIKTISEQNFPVWTDTDARSLADFLATYGYEQDEDVPTWFRRMLGNVINRTDDYFRFDFDDNADSDMSSLLLELSENYRWPVDDYGEGVKIEFPISSVLVFISREDVHPEGRGCSSIRVNRIGTGRARRLDERQE